MGKLEKIKNIYMIGIKGVGMTMLAQFLAGKGFFVSGSDTKEKFMTDEVLKSAGIKVIENFSENNVPDNADLIIYSTAYAKDNNMEVARALAGKIKTLTYAEALAEFFNSHFGLAVIGSHGKTTTTAWLGFVLSEAGLNPNVLVGSRVPQFNGFSLVGNSDYLVAEIDEYQNKFKYFSPRAAILTNIDYDHPDFFPTREDYEDAFIKFIEKLPAKGFLIANFDDPIIRKTVNVNCRAKVISYGINEAADYVAYDIKQEAGKPGCAGRQFFKVKFGLDEEGEGTRDDLLGDFSIQLSGRHNVSNALAVIAASIELEVPLNLIRTYLEEFSGTARRMQVLGEYCGATIIDDYAHHPTEIKATLAGARQIYPNKKITVVFHPHTFTRTKALLSDFSKSFGQADEVIVLDIYGSAREKQGGVSSKDLVEKIGIRNKELGIRQKLNYIPTLDECEKYLREKAERGDVIILMGAGDVFRIGENLVK
ncbi:MAG: UDP-N-acetylmuramate--L-alanine ligase [Patescibacteria group bacterium]|nr:UDP-N-acetylmuramate--L-alanine ligase [Patescibacteria group bacterium]